MSDRLFAGALTLVGLTAAVLVWASQGGSAAPGDDAGTAPAPSASGTTGTPEAGRRAQPRSDPSGSPGTGSPGAGSPRTGSGRLGGVEVLPDDAAGGGPASLPEREAAPHLELPLPAAASSLDGLVTGFPSRIIPVPPGSRVDSSSLSPGRETVQVTMQAHHRGTGRAVLRYYRIELARNGFRERQVPAAGTVSAAAFGRGADSVVVTATIGGARSTTYTVFATLHVR